MPARCAVSTALASWMPVPSTSSTLIRSARDRTARFGGGWYFMTRWAPPSTVCSGRKACTMYGWSPSWAIVFASSTNGRRMAAVSPSRLSTLTATGIRGCCCS